MNLFDIIFLDLILIIFPLMLYLIYNTYTRTLDIEKSNLYLDCALFSSYYLLIKFGILTYKEMPILIFDIPLIIAYLKNKKISIIFLSLALIAYYYEQFDISIIIFIVEYLSYYILDIVRKKIKLDEVYFLNIFITIKAIIFCICTKISINYNLNKETIITFLVLILLFYIVTNFIIYLYNKINDMFCLYKQVKNIEKEKQIKKSIFKITHEIKNPIAVCKGYLDMFDIDNINHAHKYIPILKSEINRILILLEDFLSITKVKIEKEEMDVNMLLEDTVSCLKPILNDKNINFISDISDDELYINADYNRLKQTLVNIIKNSKESIVDEGVIKLYTQSNKKNIKIIVEDTGIGMTNDELNKLKEAFFTTKKTGTGLGVYLANEIITSHNGTLEYFSKKNIGTKVIITLPI